MLQKITILQLKKKRMNYRVAFLNRGYFIHQDVANYFELLDQMKALIPNLPELFSVVYISSINSKMNVNTQEDLEAVFYSGEDFPTLKVEDLNEDIFNMTLKQNQVEMDVENSVETHHHLTFEESQITFPYNQSETESLKDINQISVLLGCTNQDALNFVNQCKGMNHDQVVELSKGFKSQYSKNEE